MMPSKTPLKNPSTRLVISTLRQYCDIPIVIIVAIGQVPIASLQRCCWGRDGVESSHHSNRTCIWSLEQEWWFVSEKQDTGTWETIGGS